MFPSQRAAFRAQLRDAVGGGRREWPEPHLDPKRTIAAHATSYEETPRGDARGHRIGHKTAFWTVVSGLIRWSPLCIAARIPFSVRQSIPCRTSILRALEPAIVQPPAAEAESRKKKKKDKFRSAWIGFVGRIVAQLVGAAATVFLALYFVDRATDPSRQAQPSARPAVPASAPAVERVSLRRHSSEKSLAACRCRTSPPTRDMTISPTASPKR